MTKTPFTSYNKRASDLLELIYSDLCGSLNKLARGYLQYYIIFTTFTDDYNRYSYVYLMRQIRIL